MQGGVCPDHAVRVGDHQDLGRVVDLADPRVADEAQIEAMIDEIGGCDVLCANAGVAGPTAPISDISLADWRACTAVNLDAAFLWAKHAAPGMRARGWGSITITSNLPFDEWTETFRTERLTGAILDRLTHHGHILEMNGESFRLRESRKAKS